MSRIKEALQSLNSQQESTVKDVPVANEVAKLGRQVREQSVGSDGRRKRIQFAGAKHAVDQENLVKIGLLPPPDRAASIADEFRLIKRPLIENATISLGVEGHQTNVIMVASAMPGAGKTFCAMNLAVGISLERELNVLLVDADVAKPHISTALGLADRPGLTNILEDESIAIEDVLVRCDMNDIQVLPAGQRHSHSTELLASERMSNVISELATRYADRIIIMDSPPLLATSEAQAMAQKVGQITLVIDYGKSQQNEVRDAIDTLDDDKPINVILNKCFYSRAGGYYGGRYGYYGLDNAQ